MNLKEATVLRINRSEAQQFLAQYEHLGNVGLGVWHWGLRIRHSLASVVSFGVPCFAQRRSFLGRVAQSCGARILQLCRGATAFWAPSNTPTRAIRLALNEIAVNFGPTLVVAYADAQYSEVGTIYQASNAVYTGLTNPKSQADYLINGQRLSGWVVRKRYGTRCRMKLRNVDSNVSVIPLRRKFRYVLLAGSPKFRRRARRFLEPHSAAYPKRAQLGIAAMNTREMMVPSYIIR